MRVTTPALLFLATFCATSLAQDDDTSSDAAAPDAASDNTSSDSPSDDASNPDNAAEPEIAALSSPTASVVSDNPEGKVYSAVFPQPTSTSVVTIGSAPNGSADVTVNLNGLPQPGPLCKYPLLHLMKKDSTNSISLYHPRQPRSIRWKL